MLVRMRRDGPSSANHVLSYQATFTQAHHDGSGLSTWIFVSSGVKYWVVITPHDWRRATSFGEIKKVVDSFYWENPERNDPGFKCIVQAFAERDDCNLELIVAKTGQLMYVCLHFTYNDHTHRPPTSIMPPGIWHEVYTPIPSVSISGHFVNWGSLHLTRVSHTIDNKQWVTNAHHPDINFILAHMLILLCYPVPDLGKFFTMTVLCI
jgi:hypothetical protein